MCWCWFILVFTKCFCSQKSTFFSIIIFSENDNRIVFFIVYFIVDIRIFVFFVQWTAWHHNSRNCINVRWNLRIFLYESLLKTKCTNWIIRNRRSDNLLRTRCTNWIIRNRRSDRRIADKRITLKSIIRKWRIFRFRFFDRMIFELAQRWFNCSWRLILINIDQFEKMSYYVMTDFNELNIETWFIIIIKQDVIRQFEWFRQIAQLNWMNILFETFSRTILRCLCDEYWVD